MHVFCYTPTSQLTLCLGYLGFTECAVSRPWVLSCSADVQAIALCEQTDTSAGMANSWKCC